MKQFKVRARETISEVIKTGRTYYVYNISFTKTNPEGLFFIYGDDEQWHRISSFSFEEVWPGP